MGMDIAGDYGLFCEEVGMHSTCVVGIYLCINSFRYIMKYLNHCRSVAAIIIGRKA
jgi:hypothetical protein